LYAEIAGSASRKSAESNVLLILDPLRGITGPFDPAAYTVILYETLTQAAH